MAELLQLNGSVFFKALVLGLLDNVNGSLEEICQFLAEDSVKITKQGLSFRFTPTAVTFMENMYIESLNLFRKNLLLDCAILQQFQSVKLLDSTYITLPNSMASYYRGYGSSYPGQPNHTEAAIKLQLVYDYLHQALSSLDIKEGVRSDQGYREYLQNIAANDLIIADLGYFVPSSFKMVNDKGAYFISRYKTATNIYDVKTHEKLELLDLLKNKSFLSRDVLLGKEAKLMVRIICCKLTSKEANMKRRKAHSLAKSHGYKSSARNQQLLDWSIFITNVPTETVNDNQISKIYKVRWQIELLFKLYKSYIKIGQFKAKANASKVLCELYAKLCIIIIFHGILGCMNLTNNAEISLPKAVLELKRRAREFFALLNMPILRIRKFLENLTMAWASFSLKDRYRKGKASTLDSLKLMPIGP